MPVLADTNLLLRAAQDGHPMQAVAQQAIAALLLRGEQVFLTRQNLVEFWVVATRPADRNGLAMTTGQAAAELARLEAQFPLIPESDAVYTEWRRLVVSYGVSGFPSYDARLVASMLVGGITRILTFNGEHFRRYSEIESVDPQEAGKNESPSSFPSYWDTALTLVGRDLPTEGGRTTFRVVEVTHERMVIRIGKRGSRRSYRRETIESACRACQAAAEVSMAVLREAGVTGREDSGMTYLPSIVREILSIRGEALRPGK